MTTIEELKAKRSNLEKKPTQQKAVVPPDDPGPVKRQGTGSKFNEERRAIILAALKAGNYRSTATSLAGVHYNTFSNWMLRGEAGEPGYAEFLEDVMQAEAESESELVNTVRTQAPDDWRAGMEILERRHPDRWSRRLRQEVSGEGGGPIEIRVQYEDPGDVIDA